MAMGLRVPIRGPSYSPWINPQYLPWCSGNNDNANNTCFHWAIKSHAFIGLSRVKRVLCTVRFRGGKQEDKRLLEGILFT